MSFRVKKLNLTHFLLRDGPHFSWKIINLCRTLLLECTTFYAKVKNGLGLGLGFFNAKRHGFTTFTQNEDHLILKNGFDSEKRL